MSVPKVSATPSVRSSTLPPPNLTVPCGVCVRVYTTARYAHLARDTVKASAARIGDSIDNDLVATP